MQRLGEYFLGDGTRPSTNHYLKDILKVKPLIQIKFHKTKQLDLKINNISRSYQHRSPHVLLIGIVTPAGPILKLQFSMQHWPFAWVFQTPQLLYLQLGLGFTFKLLSRILRNLPPFSLTLTWTQSLFSVCFWTLFSIISWVLNAQTSQYLSLHAIPFSSWFTPNLSFPLSNDLGKPFHPLLGGEGFNKCRL